MGKYKFVAVDMNKCTGCRVCEYVCTMEKHKVFNPSRSRIHVMRIYPHTNVAYSCRMCDDAPCVVSCPHKGAMIQDKTTGVISINDELCDGCDKCMKACENGSITLEGGKARMCDLCEGREGGPACIEWCPEKALELTDDDSRHLKVRVGSAQKQEEVTQG